MDFWLFGLSMGAAQFVACIGVHCRTEVGVRIEEHSKTMVCRQDKCKLKSSGGSPSEGHNPPEICLSEGFLKGLSEGFLKGLCGGLSEASAGFCGGPRDCPRIVTYPCDPEERLEQESQGRPGLVTGMTHVGLYP